MDCNKHATNVDNLTAWKRSKPFSYIIPSAFFCQKQLCIDRMGCVQCTKRHLVAIYAHRVYLSVGLSLFKELPVHVQVICNYTVSTKVICFCCNANGTERRKIKTMRSHHVVSNIIATQIADHKFVRFDYM